jgi:general stress protein CsbA
MRLSVRSPAGRLILLVLVGLLLVVDVVVTYQFFTSRYPGANDFASRWAGARAFWVDGVSPYSDEATHQIQVLIYGRPIPPEEEQEFDPGPFAYPFYTVFLLFPIVWMSYAWAEAVWLVVLEVCLFAGLLLALRLYDWRPPRWLLICTAVWVFFFYPHARALLLGQFAVLVFAAVALALWALKNERDILAGFCLALSTFKPQMVFLLIPLLLWWAVRERRWRFVVSSAAWMMLFLGASWIVEPGWLGAFVGQVSRYTSYTAIGSPIWIIAHVTFPFLGVWGEWVLSGLAIVGLIWASWWGLRQREAIWFDWVVGLCLIITNLVALRTATTNYVILLLPLVMVFRSLQHRRGSVWWILLIEVVLLVGLWVLFLATVVDRFEHPSVYLPQPFGLLAVFALARRWLVVER